MDDNTNCTPEDITEVLQYSLAAVQYPPSTWMFAYALDKVLKGEEYNLPWDASRSKASGSGTQGNSLLGYKLRGSVPMLMRMCLLGMNSTGLSVSSL